MADRSKIVLLAIDAGDHVLIENWAEEGILPVMRSAMDRGLVGRTASIEGFFVGSTWPSFYTGLTPARHGFHSLLQLRNGTYEFARVHPQRLSPQVPFWEVISAAGARVAILDMPLSGISKNINGIQTVEWGSHDAFYGFRTSPRILKWEILARFWPYPLKGACDSFGTGASDIIAFRDLLVKAVERKTQWTIHLLKREKWDLFAQAFTEAHCAGHHCWHLHDPVHPRYDDRIAAKTGDPMREVYRSLDSAIGKILARVDNKTKVIILASHRMSHYYGLQFLLPKILVRLGLAVPVNRDEGEEKTRSSVFRRDFLQRIVQRAPESVKTALDPIRRRYWDWIQKRQAGANAGFMGLDPIESSCFIVHNGSPVSGLRVNLIGREPEGRIRGGVEFDQFFDKISRDMLDLIDLKTGRKVVKAVRKTSDLYGGDLLNNLPDFLIEWEDMPVEYVKVGSDRIGILDGRNSYVRTGDHRPEGMFIALGPGIRPGRIDRTVSIMDFAPTLAEMSGVNMPGVDGVSITELLT